MGRLLVVRHAQSVWNAAGRWQGWCDAPLSELGLAQAERAGRALSSSGFRPALVACSDLARARQTAELLARHCHYRGVLAVDPGLREQGLGEWEGLTNEEIELRWPGLLEARASEEPADIPGGEDNASFARRAMASLSRVAARCKHGDCLVVAHGGVVMALERQLGMWGTGSHHPNLSGWWLEVRWAKDDPELVPAQRVELVSRSEVATP
ncbi:MAG: histidine phosphatase family protein [Acidimicrobiales bacterium]